jgi:hypothetical protein
MAKKNPGDTQEPIVIIHAQDSTTGVDAEYDWIEARFGERNQGWHFIRQRLMKLDPGRWLDVIDIKLPDGTTLELRFDITEFCGLSSHGKESDDSGDGDDAPTIG